jgi:pteridine reductase
LLADLGGPDAGATFQGDLAQVGTPDALMEAVMSRFGRFDLLVNSAASFVRTPLESVTPETFDTIMAVNLRAPFFLSLKAADVMRSRSMASGNPTGGHIINLADLAAFESWSQWLPHSMAKGGVVQMTKGMARAFGPSVRVNAIAPGVVLLPDDWPGDMADGLKASTPLGRHGTPDDVVAAMNYLLDATFVTGETVLVDGGRLVRNRGP